MLGDNANIAWAIFLVFIMFFAARGGARPSQAKEAASKSVLDTGALIALFIILFLVVMTGLYLTGLLNGK